MQQILLERLGGTNVEYTARSTESVLARLHFVVRVPVGRRGSPKPLSVDADALQAELAAAARSWTDDLSDALHARHGAEAEKMLARVADAFPASYQEDFSAEQAVDDLERLDGLADGQLVAAAVVADGRGTGRPSAQHLPGRAATAAVRGAAGPAAHGRGRRRRAPLRDRPHRRSPDLDLRLRRRGATGRAAAAALAARAVHRGRRRGLARRGRGRRPGRAGDARRTQLAPGQRRACLRAVAAAGRSALRSALRRGDAGRPPRRRRPPGRPVRGALLPRTRAGAATLGRPIWWSRCGRRSARSSRWTPTGCSPRCWPPSLPPSGRRTTPAGPWRSSSTRTASPTCRSRARPARSGSARRASWASTCASARSPAAGCAGPTAARTCAPRSSAWSRRRW